MSCPPPCGHHFCWLCFKPAGTRGHYACDVYRPPPPDGAGGEAETEEEATARQARASLDRYARTWTGNLRSLEKVRQDTDELELELEPGHGRATSGRWGWLPPSGSAP